MGELAAMKRPPGATSAKLARLREALAEGERSGFAEDFSWERLDAELDLEAECASGSKRVD